MLLDVRWYDKVLDKFWYLQDEFKVDENGYYMVLQVNKENYLLNCRVFHKDIEDEFRTLDVSDRFTGFTTYGEKIYENDILHRQINIIFYGVKNEGDNWIDDYVVPKYSLEYGGFFVGEEQLYHQFKRNYTDGFKCTHFKKIGNVYQNKELIEEVGES